MVEFPKMENFDPIKGHVIDQLSRLNVHQLRRLAMGLELVSSDEIVLDEAEGFKKKIIDHIEKVSPSELQIVKRKIELAEENH